MKRLLSLAALAGAGYAAWRYYQGKARPAARVPTLPTDDLLERRVQVSIRQAGAMPEQLRVRVVGGTVVLSGSVTAAERDRILRAILAAPGIRGVRNELDVQGVVRDPDLAVESRPWEPSPRPR
jgi:osmotically-inducible protein OsmY